MHCSLPCRGSRDGAKGWEGRTWPLVTASLGKVCKVVSQLEVEDGAQGGG